MQDRSIDLVNTGRRMGSRVDGLGESMQEMVSQVGEMNVAVVDEIRHMKKQLCQLMHQVEELKDNKADKA